MLLHRSAKQTAMPAMDAGQIHAEPDCTVMLFLLQGTLFLLVEPFSNIVCCAVLCVRCSVHMSSHKRMRTIYCCRLLVNGCREQGWTYATWPLCCYTIVQDLVCSIATAQECLIHVLSTVDRLFPVTYIHVSAIYVSMHAKHCIHSIGSRRGQETPVGRCVYAFSLFCLHGNQSRVCAGKVPLRAYGRNGRTSGLGLGFCSGLRAPMSCAQCILACSMVFFSPSLEVLPCKKHSVGVVCRMWPF